jgi:hypothetical protein
MPIKTALLIFTLFVGQTAFSQSDKVKKQSSDKFYLYYGIAGMGSNMGRLMPTLRVQNHKFIYTKEQNSYYGKRSKKKEFITSGTFRQNSIDSILSLISELKDSAIYQANPCIMSGSITTITIAYGTDTTHFTLHNTSDYTVIKIVDIINAYFPKDRKLYNSIEEIKREEECWTWLKEKVEKQIADSIKVKQ